MPPKKPSASAAAAAAAGTAAGGAAPSPAAAAAAAAAAGPSADLTPLLGLSLQLTLHDGSSAAGQLWAYDAPLQLLVLEAPSNTLAAPAGAACLPVRRGAPAAGATGFRLLKTRAIRHIALAAAPPGAPMPLSPLAPLSVAAVEGRERAAVVEAEKRARKIGKDVSEHAQAVFEALDKTLPCRWHDAHIIVFDEVAVSPPYTSASTNVPDIPRSVLSALADGETPDAKAMGGKPLPQGAVGKARSWQRVCKVLDGELLKMKARAAAEGRA